ncbi:manganese efflux pump MntP family protein [Ruminococcaceae bacterium OttesenSCG-928-A16]|nr:manganese efflux pump MntP family protein [Ruminococcaceae bacterium OttesenSCG-928-A16]
MSITMLFFTALALSMDAFAVSVSNSMCFTGLSKKQGLANSACFGLFQGIMPIIGFFAGQLLGNFIAQVDHWVALILLGFIGGKMLLEGIQALRKPESCPAKQNFTLKTMVVQAIATSIDALAVGISFAALSVNIWGAAGIIALTTFVCCLIGVFLGHKFGLLLGDWAQIFGGAILVGIGLKIFVEHMMGG